MKINEIMMHIRELACSQGYWGRLYEDLAAIEKYEPERWKVIVKRLEAEQFDTELDMILYFEEGKHCHAKYWKIPVTWEVCGVVEVEGKTIEEALENFNKTEDEIGLPDDAEYVDDSFRLSNDNKEELIAMIKIINKVQEEKK